MALTTLSYYNKKIAILDSTGTAVVQYKYDAWGNHTISGSNITLGNLDPFRYRSYYYDTETKLYFLQSRYYDPEEGRFLNMDSIDYADPETLNGLNLYAYCGNNPVMNVDPSGHLGVFFTILLTVIAGAIVSSTISVTEQVIKNEGDFSKINWRIVGGAALSGAALGFAFGIGGAIGAGAKIGLSIGQALGLVSVVNIVAGMGAYAIENGGTENFKLNGMLLSGFAHFGKSLINFTLGGMYGASGLWGVGEGNKGTTSFLPRGIGKGIITFIPFGILNLLWENK